MGRGRPGRRRSGGGDFPEGEKGDAIAGAGVEAIEAGDTAGCIDLVVTGVNTLGLARAMAARAGGASGGVEVDPKDGKAGEDTQGPADRADCVAEKAAAGGGHGGNNGQRGRHEEKGRDGPWWHGGSGKVSAGGIEQKDGGVVENGGDRFDGKSGESAEDAVGIEPTEGGGAEGGGGEENQSCNDEMGTGKARMFLVTGPPATPGEPGDDILVSAERANAGAVDAAEENCEQNDEEKSGSGKQAGSGDAQEGGDKLGPCEGVSDGRGKNLNGVEENGKQAEEESKGDDDPEGAKGGGFHGRWLGCCAVKKACWSGEGMVLLWRAGFRIRRGQYA